MPEAYIDWKRVDELLESGSPGTEVAAYFGIHPDTLYLRAKSHYGMGFSDYLHQKRSSGEAKIRYQQFAKAIGLDAKGDNTMLIWLGKARLQQRENYVDDTPANDKQLSELISSVNQKEVSNAAEPKADSELPGSDTPI